MGKGMNKRAVDLQKVRHIWAFIIAFVLRLFTKVLSPIHEAMHWLIGAVQGQRTVDFAWDHIWIEGINNVTIVGAYFAELVLYTLLMVKAKRTFRWFAFGVLHALILRAFPSYDLADFPAARYVFIWLWFGVIVVSWVSFRALQTLSPEATAPDTRR